MRGIVRSLVSKQPVTDRTLFQICSITKSFTATLIALQVADGSLAWDDPIERHLPDWLHTTGAPYSQLLRERIFEPLEMRDSTVILMPRPMDLLAHPYRWDDSSEMLVPTLPQSMDALAPSGDIRLHRVFAG